MFTVRTDRPIPSQSKTGLTDFLKTLNPGDSFDMDYYTSLSARAISGRIGFKIRIKRNGDVYTLWRIS